MLMSEEDLRKRIAELDERQKQFTWDEYAPDGYVDRSAYSKAVLRAQIKGLKSALGETYDLMGDD